MGTQQEGEYDLRSRIPAEGRKCDRFREHILGRRLLEWGLLQEYGRTWEVIAPENGNPF